MNTKPQFLDLGEDTIRVDPQKKGSSYIRLSLLKAQTYDEVTGQVLQPPQAFETWLPLEHAHTLANMLLRARYGDDVTVLVKQNNV